MMIVIVLMVTVMMIIVVMVVIFVMVMVMVMVIRPAQLAELPRSKFDPELFPHSAYVKIFVTFATKVPYLTFCDKF